MLSNRAPLGVPFNASRYGERAMQASRLLIATCAGLGAIGSQAASVDLQPYVDANVSSYTSGADYPTGMTTIGGISFSLASFGTGTGVIQLDGVESHTIPVDQTEVDTAYVIINSAWGVFGENNGQLVFTGDGGKSVEIDLIQGTTIRDHWTAYNTIASDVFATATYDGGNRFDVYRYDISALGGSLASVTFASTNASRPGGAPFLAALTTAYEMSSPVPEPESWMLMAAGLALVTGMRRPRSRRR